MNLNMGGLDRVIRVIVAIVLAVLYFTGTVTGTLGIIFLVVAIFFLLTVIFGTCILYLPFGLSTKGGAAAPATAPAVPTPPEPAAAPPTPEPAPAKPEEPAESPSSEESGPDTPGM